jgi:hypothetical protein
MVGLLRSKKSIHVNWLWLTVLALVVCCFQLRREAWPGWSISRELAVAGFVGLIAFFGCFADLGVLPFCISLCVLLSCLFEVSGQGLHERVFLMAAIGLIFGIALDVVRKHLRRSKT